MHTDYVGLGNVECSCPGPYFLVLWCSGFLTHSINNIRSFLFSYHLEVLHSWSIFTICSFDNLWAFQSFYFLMSLFSWSMISDLSRLTSYSFISILQLSPRHHFLSYPAWTPILMTEKHCHRYSLLVGEFLSLYRPQNPIPGKTLSCSLHFFPIHVLLHAL